MKFHRDNQDVTNLSFGRLTAIKLVDRVKGRVRWLFKCSCGTEKVLRIKDVKNGNTKSCGCLKIETVTKRALEASGKWARLPNNVGFYNKLFNIYKGDAKRKGRAFNIAREDFARLVQKDCFYCGNAPNSFFVQNRQHTKHSMKYNGLDRIDNSIGYEYSNIVTCCRNCNLAKRTLTVEAFVELCRKVVKLADERLEKDK